MHAQPSSNRVRKSKYLGPVHLPIIDTITVRGPVSHAWPEENVHVEKVDKRTGEAQWEVRVKGKSTLTFDSGQQVVMTVRGGQARMEFSVPRVLWGHNVVAATVQETAEVVREA